ncbi:MAG: gamma carbonic anhydrase family protein [Frankiales bacterium]|nr:gamma carbonic anhydrase family protein [Frankiales bacterium]
MLLSLPGRAPDVAATAWVADTARVVGAVTLGEQASVWYSAVLRGDGDSIRVGHRTNLQDGCVLHADPGFPLVVGAGVSVGHAAVLHGCTVEDDVLVGMGAVVMNGARIGTGSMIGAGALVSPGTVVPPGSLVVGTPGKVRRETTAEERELIALNAAVYLDLVEQHRQAQAV